MRVVGKQHKTVIVFENLRDHLTATHACSIRNRKGLPVSYPFASRFTHCSKIIARGTFIGFLTCILYVCGSSRALLATEGTQGG